MTGYKADTNVFRTDGQSDQYWAFATMWRIPDNLLHVIVNINASFGSDYFALISQHNLGGELLYSHVPPIYQGGGTWLHSHFSGEKIYYIAILLAYPGKGKIWL